MFEMISDFARDFTQIDNQSMIILLVMVGWATLLIHLAVDSKTYTALFVPGMVIGGMAAFYLERNVPLTMVSTKEINAIILSVLGIVAGFLATVLVISLIHWIGEIRRPLTLDSRT
jgi:glycopeptide antibiotics resistance protein